MRSSGPGALPARALWFTGPGTVELRAEKVPGPGPGEVRVRAAASGLSAGTEMLVYRGEAPADLRLDLPTLAGSYGFPIKYGYAAAGRVLDVGPDVDHLSPGDAVFVHHPHQSVFTIPAALAVPLPPELDVSLGIFTANIETAVGIVHDAAPRFEETVLVLGQGVVGLLVAGLLRLADTRVISVDPLPRRRALSRGMGVEEVLEPSEDLSEIVLASTGGRGADVVVETSGSGAALQTAIDAVAGEGTVVVASWYGTKPVTLSLGEHFHRNRTRIVSSQVGRINPQMMPRWDRDRRMETVVGLLPRLHLSPLISHRIPFSNAPEAYSLLAGHPDEAAQILLTYDGSDAGEI